MFIRKARAGSDSFGHTWDTDGAVVEMPGDEGLVLLAIPDGGFTEVAAPDKKTKPAEATPVTEPAPPADDDTTPIDEGPARPKRGRRTNVTE